jgi:hypothetical protein
MKKLSIGLIATSGIVVSSLAGAVLFNGVAHGEWDLPGLNQQVQHLTEQAANHEARITNVENKINTPADQPTPTPQVVTKVVTEQAPPVVAAPMANSVQPAPAAEATPVPKTVTSVKHNLCLSTMTHTTVKLVITDYSDGTTVWTTETGEAFVGACMGGAGGTW